VRIRRGLARFAHQRLKLRYPGRQKLNQRRLLQKQGVLLGLTQANERRATHPYLDSFPESGRNPKNQPREQLRHKGMKYLHWNMRDINYGFAALEHRFRVLGGTPVVIEDGKKIDLARLLIDIYGVGYIGHPRLETLLAKNSIKPRDFLTGPQEAEAFEKRNFVGLHQSTLRKVDVIANLAERAHSRQLKTNTTWWEMHGGRVRTVLNWMAENRTFQLVAGLASIAGLVLAIWVMR
jgi:hypothetical protein